MFRNDISLNCVFSAFPLCAISADIVYRKQLVTLKFKLFLYIYIFCVGIICWDELPVKNHLNNCVNDRNWSCVIWWQILMMNSSLFPLVFSNIFPVFVSYITVLHFMLCLISSKMTWVRKHVLNSFILFPSVILMWCSSHTPFVTAAVFQHAGVI